MQQKRCQTTKETNTHTQHSTKNKRRIAEIDDVFDDSFNQQPKIHTPNTHAHTRALNTAETQTKKEMWKGKRKRQTMWK